MNSTLWLRYKQRGAETNSFITCNHKSGPVLKTVTDAGTPKLNYDRFLSKPINRKETQLQSFAVFLKYVESGKDFQAAVLKIFH